jgi:hypothetical protein
MPNPVTFWKNMDKGDRYMLLSSIAIPLAFWWFYIGRKKYTAPKGAR